MPMSTKPPNTASRRSCERFLRTAGHAGPHAHHLSPPDGANRANSNHARFQLRARFSVTSHVGTPALSATHARRRPLGLLLRLKPVGHAVQPFMDDPPRLHRIILLLGLPRDRKSVVSGKHVSVRVDFGGRRTNKKKKKP